MPGKRRRVTVASEYILASGIVAGTAVIGLVLRHRLATIDIAMLFLLAVVMVASRYRQGPALLASVLSIAAFDFVFVPPYYTFGVHESAYILTFGVMMLVAVLMSHLTARLREQAEEAGERERLSSALYALDQELAGAGARSSVATIAGKHIGRATGGVATVILTDDLRREQTAPQWPTKGIFENTSVRVAAMWALEHGETAGWGTDHCGEAEAIVIPLRTTARTIGVAALRLAPPERLLPAADYRLVGALADHAAIAFERALLAERHEMARAEVEAERLRTSLLSSLSHDLRTPLASIEGAASSLLQDRDALPVPVQQDLAETILEESRRMTRLVSNLLDMVRVETGALSLKKSWQPLEESLGVALLRLEERLAAHPVLVTLPEILPLVPIDELLIEQVFINLLENAAKYTPAGTPITVAARVENGAVTVEVADRGPGIPTDRAEAVFRKFYRTPAAAGASTAAAGSSGGAGLGLTICRGIIAAHGGRIWVEPGPGGGAAFRFTLPLQGPPLDGQPAEAAGD